MVARKAHNLEVTGSNPVSAISFLSKRIESIHYYGGLSQILAQFFLVNKVLPLGLGRIAGIEPASSPWQREILPFDHIRIFVLDTQYVHTYMRYMPGTYLCRARTETLLRVSLIIFFNSIFDFFIQEQEV